MKITPKMLCIPPYISTSWKNISSIFVKQPYGECTLVISLNDDTKIEIPNLPQREIDEIFFAHANFTDEENSENLKKSDNSVSFAIPFPIDSAPLDFISANLQHNPEQSSLPNIPKQILEKISSIIQTLDSEESPFLEKAEPDCNCIYCQLYRTSQKEELEEEITEEDLKFKDWEITQKEDKLYHVINPLDSSEYYDVYLGEPLGCTCGCKNCEHIKAVLNT